MMHVLAAFRLEYIILFLFLAFSVTYGTPSSYNLFQGTAYSGTGHKHGDKNWCAYVVHKNVTCAVLGDTATFVEAELVPCPVYHPDCPQQVRYHMLSRPVYKIGYKMVTELEWRCCPGHQGPDCKDLKHSPPRQVAVEPNSTRHSPGPVEHTKRPAIRDPVPTQQQQGSDRVHPQQQQGSDRVHQLEDEVQRLSQTVLDLQAAMTGMNENLRVNIQEDTSKMLLTLISELRLPDAALAGTTESVQLSSHEPGVEPSGIEEVRSKLSDVTDTLRNKNHALDELRDMVSSHDSQLRLLMEAARGPLATAPIPTIDPSPQSQDSLQMYIDEKIKDLKDELMEGIEIKMADIRSSCEYKIMSVQEQCEESETNYLSLTELMESKEDDLRKEIQNLQMDLNQLRTNGQGAIDQQPSSMNDLQNIAEAYQALNARVNGQIELLSMPQMQQVLTARLEDLEARLNISERNSEMHCFNIEKRLNQLIVGETASLRELLTEKFAGLNESSFFGIESGNLEDLANDVSYSKQLVQGLESKLNAMGELCSTNCSSDVQNNDKIVKELNLLRNDMELMNSKVNDDREKLQELKEDSQVQMQNIRNLFTLQNRLDSLGTEVGSLGSTVAGLGNILNGYSYGLQQVNSTCGKMVTQEVQKLLDRDRTQGSIDGNWAEEQWNQLKQLASKVRVEISECKDSAEEVRREVSVVSGRVTCMEGVCNKLDGVSTSLQRIKEGLNKHVTDLWTCVHQINRTLMSYASDTNELKGSFQDFQTRLSRIAKETQDLVTRISSGPGDIGQAVIHASDNKTSKPHVPGTPQASVPLVTQPSLMGTPQQPVLETGVAGPPSTMHRSNVKLPQSDGSMTPVKGFAGAPGYPPLIPVSFKPNAIPVTHTPQKTAVHKPPMSPDPAGFSTDAGPFSFSAGLTTAPSSGDTGIVRFNTVLLNDGRHYSPDTGVFTVPLDGRYLLSAVLTAEQGERVEAMLSVSSHSVQKLSTGGYWAGRRWDCLCGGSASFSLVLGLKQGDRVSLVVTAGKLALADSGTILSTFSGVFLYPPPPSS